MNENITENIEESESEEAIAENAVEEIDRTAAEGEAVTAAEAAIKPKSKMFILYICALVIFMAVAVTALVCFGVYANNLVHGEEAVSAVNSFCRIMDCVYNF